MDLTVDVISQVDATLALWPNPPDDNYIGALRIIGMYLTDNCQWDSKSDYLLARIVGMFSIGQLRAHTDQVYKKKQGAFTRTAQLPDDIRFNIEQSTARARYLLLKLMLRFTDRDWSAVFDVLENFNEWDDFRSPDGFDFTEKHWTVPFANVLNDIPWRLAKAGQASDGLDAFKCWFQTDFLNIQPISAFADLMLKHDGKK